MTRNPSARSRAPSILATLLLAAAVGPAFAAPEGEDVVNGDVTFHRDGSVTLIRASDGAIIEYDSFDIFANEVVEFVQPGADARVLNRVFGEATHIEGSLLANGIVYIVNPAGIFLDGEAVVDVGGLVAASGHISNEDFLAGTDHFDLTGPVQNASDSIEARSVSLLGTTVANLGQISAPDGTIALVAGDRVVLTRLGGRIYVEVDGPPAETPGGVGVIQAGRIDAGGGQVIFAVGDHYSLAINHEGVTRGHDVLLRGGDDGLLLVRGEIDASGAAAGGSIAVTGDKVALLGARLDASGGTGGGAIRIGGARRGEGPLPNARRTFVDSSSELVADAIAMGDGGEVIVWGEEAAVMNGSISARGGAESGNGGFAEISSPGALAWGGAVDLGADAGSSGTLLFDPQDIVIQGGSSDGSDAPNASATQLASDAGTVGTILFGDVGDGSNPFLIYESEIEGTNANVVLEATNSVTTAGTFSNQVAAEGNDVVVVGGGNDLTIRTRNDTGDDTGSLATSGIDLGALAWRTAGGDVTIETGATAVAFDTVADVSVGNITTAGGAVRLSTQNGAIAVGDVVTSGANAATGGAAGAISLVARGTGTSGVTGGDLIAIGGTGVSGAGGNGGAVTVNGADGSIALGAIDSSGGDGTAQALRGRAGAITVTAGSAEDGTGSIALSGPVTAIDGDGFGLVNANTTLVLDAKGTVEFDAGVAGPQIRTTENVRLAGASVGATTQIEIDAVETAGTPTGAFSGRRLLTVEASDTADVAVTSAASFNSLFVVAKAAEADIDVVQAGNGTDPDGTSIEITGAPGVSTVVGVDGVDSGVAGGVSVRIDLVDALEGVDDESLDLVVGTGAIVSSAGLRLLSEDDVLLAEGAIVTAPTAGGAPGAPLETGIVDIRADLDDDGDGAVATSSMGAPHITTEGDVLLVAPTVGAGGRLEIDAVSIPTAPLADGSAVRTLRIEVEESADIAVTNGAFDALTFVGRSSEADFDAIQVGGGTAVDPGFVLDIDGAAGTSTLMRLDSTDPAVAHGITVQLQMIDELQGDDDVDYQFVVAGGAVTAGGELQILAEDDVVLEDGAIAMSALDPGNPTESAALTILADSGNSSVMGDGTGAILGSGTAIDMNADGSTLAGRLDLLAGSGIGAPGAALGIANAGSVSATNGESGGVHLTSLAGDGFALASASIREGDGDVVVTSTAGDLAIAGPITAPGDGGGLGGAVTIGVTQPGAQIELAGGGLVIDANGPVTFDGDVALLSPATVQSAGDVAFNGAIDGNPDPIRVQRILVVDADGATRFGGDVGSVEPIRGLDVDGDVVLAQDTRITVLDTIDIGGNLDAETDDAASATLVAGDGVRFGGDVGTSGRLSGLTVESDVIGWVGAGDPDVIGDGAQQVVTGAGGIHLDPDGLGSPPPNAPIAALDGDLTLSSTGTVEVGANQKLTVEGNLALAGDVVRIGDANALEIRVASDDFQIMARETGPLLLASGSVAPDRGVDLFANVIETSSVPGVVGAGPAPSIATLSGTVDGAGAGSIPVSALGSAITPEDLRLGPVSLDLGFTSGDPGHEEPLLDDPVAPLLPALPTDDRSAGSATPPDEEQVLAFLRCVDAEPGPGAGDCAPARGSSLDSRRGDDLADRYRRLLGGSAEGRAARRVLAGDPSSSEARAVLRDLATLLIELRLLGLDAASYEGLRAELLAAAHAGGAGASEAALLESIREQGRGVSL